MVVTPKLCIVYVGQVKKREMVLLDEIHLISLPFLNIHLLCLFPHSVTNTAKSTVIFSLDHIYDIYLLQHIVLIHNRLQLTLSKTWTSTSQISDLTPNTTD